MDWFSILPLLAGIALVVFVLFWLTPGYSIKTTAWIFPAIVSGLFLAWSLFAVVFEGPLGFWPVHTANAWGNQVWFDLLLAAGIALALMVPEARKLGMRPLPWSVLVLCTGSIGLLAMMARLMYLRDSAQAEK